jgi:hypothetical protein
MNSHLLIVFSVLAWWASCSQSNFSSDGRSAGVKGPTSSNAGNSDHPIDVSDNGTTESCKKKNKGRIIVSNDEWVLSDTGVRNSPDALTFAKNVALWLGGCEGRNHGVFHAYSTNFGVTEPSLRNALISQGHSWTTGLNFKITPESLQKIDWLFLAGPVPDAAAIAPIIVEFVKNGGGLYIAGGTGAINQGSAAAEASTWNPIISEFGIQFASQYNGLKKIIPISGSSHPIFAGVSGLYQDNGNSISLNGNATAKSKILVTDGGQGIFAIYDGSQ